MAGTRSRKASATAKSSSPKVSTDIVDKSSGGESPALAVKSKARSLRTEKSSADDAEQNQIQTADPGPTTARNAADDSVVHSSPPSAEFAADGGEVLVDDAAIELALEKDIPDETGEKSSSADGDEGVVDGDDWAEEEKQLREENRRRLLEEKKKSKKMSSREKVQLLDNLLQKAAAYSAFLRGRMQEAVAVKECVGKAGQEERDPRQPALVTGAIMRKYQVEGVLWMASLYENGLNGILADEMGLGKTLQTIAFIAHLYEMKVFGPFLVVAPLSTIQNWSREFSRFAPSVPTIVYHGSKDDRKEMREKITERKGMEWPVVITSFEVAMNDAKILSRLPKGGSWKYLVVDEGHRLKNKDCRLLRELKALPTDNRLLLSGTPLQNNLTELWSLLNFILPQIFTDLSTFQNWFDFEDDLNAGEGASERIIAEEQANKTISKLHTILDPFLLRRLKSDVELGLPDKREYIIYAPFSPTQVKINQAIADRKLEELCTAESSSGFQRAADGSWSGAECVGNVNDKSTSLQNIVMQMRKCCNHPYLFQAPKDPCGNVIVDERLVQSAGKLHLLDRILPILKSRKHKVLIFCQMTIMMDLLEDYLDLRHYKSERIDGTVPWKERQERMDRYNTDEDSFVFLLSTRAGGIGINLVAADTVIFYDSDWNPQQDLQAQDRCHRIGQTRSNHIYTTVLAGDWMTDIIPLCVNDCRTRSVYNSAFHSAAISKFADAQETSAIQPSVRPIADDSHNKRKLELVAIARKRFKVADKVEHGAKLEDLQAAGKDKRAFVAQVRESMTAEELTDLLRRRHIGDTCKEAVISDSDLETLMLVRKRGEGVADEGRGWMCVSTE